MHNLLAVLLFPAVFTIATAKQFISNKPAISADLLRTGYPLGNGKLGLIPLGGTVKDVLSLNYDSLWSGGPFQNPKYNGGNPFDDSQSKALPGIREFIFKEGEGNVTALYGDGSNYGAYESLGNVTIAISGLNQQSKYRRTLDLGSGVHQTSFQSDGKSYTSTMFCSYPAQACVYHLTSSSQLPDITVALENPLRVDTPFETTCNAGKISLFGLNHLETGMKYNYQAKVVAPHQSCPSSDTILVPSNKDTNSVLIIIAAGTDFDQKKGNAEHGYSFKGVDPAAKIAEIIAAAAKKTFEELLAEHLADFEPLFNAFSLELPDTASSEGIETSVLLESYESSMGNPFVDSLLFEYGRYLFISSSRPGTEALPPNLQGMWQDTLKGDWGCDYHANINLQMNHWSVDQTGLGELQEPLWTYMTENWMPRGAETAKLLYAGKGWVTHSEMNIFGHTGMKDTATWTNYQASGAWMMDHVWDHYDYSRDVTWYYDVGYPMLKGVVQFWMSQLQSDKYFNDGSLVANPCNSPEHGATTFGCAAFQQTIWQTFDHFLHGWDVVKDSDDAFHGEVQALFNKLDDGIHIGSWGQLQEWKIDLDVKNDTHRHISGLHGWYPGYGIASLHSQNKTVTDAVETLLWARSEGNASDGNTGWEKILRSPLWARLNNTERAYFQFSYTISTNIANNGLSMLGTSEDGLVPPFQIDANFGIVGATLEMLVRDIGRPHSMKGVQTVVLGPVIPPNWGPGKVKGLRIRGKGVVDFEWGSDGIVTKAKIEGRLLPLVIVDKNGVGLVKI